MRRKKKKVEIPCSHQKGILNRVLHYTQMHLFCVCGEFQGMVNYLPFCVHIGCKQRATQYECAGILKKYFCDEHVGSNHHLPIQEPRENITAKMKFNVYHRGNKAGKAIPPPKDDPYIGVKSIDKDN